MEVGSTDDFRSYNRGPATTTFTPPSTCLETTSVYIAGYADPPANRTASYYIGAWPPSFPDYLVDTTSNACVPPAATPIPLAQTWYYSPAICPSDYTPAVSLATGVLDTFNSEGALPSSVTAWLCCPSNYAPSPGITNAPWSYTITCTSAATDIATLTSVWSPTVTDPESGSVWPITPPASDVTPATVVAKPTVIAEGIPIMWESTDTEVQSWFNSYYQANPSLLGAAAGPTNPATAPSLTTSTTAPTSTNGQAEKGSNLSAGMLGLLLIVSFILRG